MAEVLEAFRQRIGEGRNEMGALPKASEFLSYSRLTM